MEIILKLFVVNIDIDCVNAQCWMLHVFVASKQGFGD
jgi:hypothetical protein